MIYVSKRYTVTRHGFERAKQRSNYTRNKDIQKLFEKAVRYGKNPTNFKPPFSDYLKNKLVRGSKVKVYAGMIFIYKNSKLLTTYAVPEQYKQQIVQDRMEREIMQHLNKVPNIVKLNEFISLMDGFIKLVHTNISLDIYCDEKTLKEIDEVWFKTVRVGKAIMSSTHNTKYKSNLALNERNVVSIMRETNDSLFKNVFDNDKLTARQVRANIFHDISDLMWCLMYISKRSYFLVQNQLIMNQDWLYIKDVEEERIYGTRSKNS